MNRNHEMFLGQSPLESRILGFPSSDSALLLASTHPDSSRIIYSMNACTYNAGMCVWGVHMCIYIYICIYRYINIWISIYSYTYSVYIYMYSINNHIAIYIYIMHTYTYIYIYSYLYICGNAIFTCRNTSFAYWKSCNGDIQTQSTSTPWNGHGIL